ncbi:regulatory protein RecX [Sphingomonas arantia]|uniref:Regulatory protein RecX n=1 Tax=Sphingomonas arantia TaxID=1460676 RepID=A0ABW4TYH6_9SPHN
MARHSSNRNPDRVRPPLDREGLERLALHYLGRYATTRAKLSDYLHRKLKERGWAGVDLDAESDGGAGATVEAIVVRMAELGYVDDRVFAEMRSAALGRRGYGRRRQADALRAAGVGEEDRAAALAPPEEDEDGDEPAVNSDHAAAMAFAKRKRIGPFATAALDPDMRRKALAAMMRAGHPYDLARRFVDCPPGEVPEE